MSSLGSAAPPIDIPDEKALAWVEETRLVTA
jgi:hypothetical protein